jgi:hypothetical protein
MCIGQLADLCCKVSTEYIYICISITGPVTTCRPATKLDTEFDVNKSRACSPCCPSSLYFGVLHLLNMEEYSGGKCKTLA